jgi:ADP-ribose pyrophosphatase YjhB (NUDIX family)
VRDRALRGVQLLWDVCPQPIRRLVLHALNARFMVGVVGLIHDDRGRVLLLQHRFRTPYRWGLPGGFMKDGEDLAGALRRELREEIAVEVEIDPVAFDTEVVGGGSYLSVTLLGRPSFDPERLEVEETAEIVGGGFYGPGELPEDTYPYQRLLIERFWRR